MVYMRKNEVDVHTNLHVRIFKIKYKIEYKKSESSVQAAYCKKDTQGPKCLMLLGTLQTDNERTREVRVLHAFSV